MAKDFNNRLITPELEKAMQDYPLYSQDSKKKDAVCIAVFFIGNARWYILEGQRENDDFVLFGIVVGLAETEYSYISANEMASVELDATKFGLGKVRVEQRKPFQPCQLSEIIDKHLGVFILCGGRLLRQAKEPFLGLHIRQSEVAQGEDFRHKAEFQR